MSAGAPALGVVEWFEPHEYERAERVAESLRAIGVEHVRTGVSWADWHGPRGADWYDWLLPALARDFELLPCVTYTPPSLGVAPHVTSPPRRPRDYADFVDLLITRHGELFEHVELWNEPNNLSDWDWRVDTTWTVFCEMVGAAAHWARRRGKKTVLGGMSPIDPPWLELVGAQRLLEQIDAVGIHAFPGTWEAEWDGWTANVERVEEALERVASDAAVWITECGFSTWRGEEDGQVRALRDVLEAPVERVYWYSAEDLAPDRVTGDGSHVDERDYHFGLRMHEGQPKLLYHAWPEHAAVARPAARAT